MRWLWRLGPVFALAFAGWLIHRALREFSLEEIRAALRMLSPGHVALAVAFTAASYLSLTGFDALGVRYTHSALRYRRIAFTSFVALSLGHTLGFAALSSGTIRLRLYTGFGLSAGTVAQVIVMCAVTVLLGLCTVAGIGALLTPRLTADVLRLSFTATVLLGCALLSVGAIYLVLTAAMQRDLRVWGRTVRMPSFRLALAQLIVGTLDFLLVAAVLHQMLVAVGANIGYPTIATLYVVANAAAIITHVPGGLGVIEAVVLSLVPSPKVAGALLAFRVVYYLVPFIIGCVLFGGFELSRYFRTHRRTGARSHRLTA
jgi:uncharacterized membrane protein YbhN (UPF0104 family)